MIITCNCGLKKFSLPDNSIPAAGRMVQCGSCGLKWKQFPVNEINNTEPISNIKNIASEPKQVQPKRQKAKKVKKTSVRKRREIDLYSPEYLAKKHGIKLGNEEIKKTSSNEKVSLGFSEDVNLASQKERILQKIESINKQISNLSNKLKNKAYVKNAPKEIVQNDKKLTKEF